ncbi:MAG: hypothetical protein KJ025_22025 [Burkholderiales bacterium]|nr:hypothetical protein [Burkholderiales bacterium]
MAEPLKRFFNAEVVRAIAADLRRIYPAFRERRFVEDCVAGLDELALLERGWRIAEALHEHLPSTFLPPRASSWLRSARSSTRPAVSAWRPSAICRMCSSCRSTGSTTSSLQCARSTSSRSVSLPR